MLTVIFSSLMFTTSCATISEVFMQDDTTIYISEDIEEEARVETPLPGGQINIAMPTDVTSFDPLKIRNINMANIYTLIFESPLSIDVDGVIRSNLVENWSVDVTGMIWTFQLRKNIMWHNGLGEMTAEDFVYTLDVLTKYTSDQSIYARYNKRIGKYYAQDKYTFILETIDPTIKKGDYETVPKPSSYIEYAMTFPVLCKEYYEKSDNIDTAWPIGTGPYEFTSYQEDEGIRLDINDDWWKEKPYISSIYAKPIPDAASEIVAYANQEIDLLGTSDRSANRYRKYGVTNVDEYMTQYYDCLVPNLYVPKNNAEPKFVHDIKARQAIAHAINKAQIISKGLINHAVATDVPIPPDSWLFDATLSIYEHNQNQAIILLEELGYTHIDENGFRFKTDEETGELVPLEIELMYPKEINDSYKQNIASLIEEQLEDVGMNVSLREIPSSDTFQKKIRAGSFDLALLSYYIDRNPDPRFMLHSTRGVANYGRYNGEFMDMALEECAVALTVDAKKAAFSNVQDEFIQQLPQIPLYFMTNSLVYDYSIKGISNYRALSIFNDIQSWYVVSEVQ